MGLEPTYSSSSSDDFTPNPCDTPRPSTPYCAREREHLKATISWAGMYDRLDDREEALAKARSDRSRSATPSSSSSSSTAKYGEMSRTTTISFGSSGKGKKEQIVWKTAYEDDISKDELGRQLDEQAKNNNNAWDDADTDEDSDEEVYGSSKSLFRAVPQSGIKDEEESEMPRNSVFRAWNDVDSDDEDQVDKDGEEDSDDDISERDIEPDPSSPSTSSGPCGDDLTATESTIESVQVNQDTEMEIRRKEEREKEREQEEEREREKKEEQEKAVPAPYVRTNARSFLQMFFRPRAPPTPITENDDQSKRKEEERIPTATGQTSSLAHDEKKTSGNKATYIDTPSQLTCEAKEKELRPTMAETILRSADSDDDADSGPSMIHSVGPRDSDEDEDDPEGGEKDTPDTSLDSHSDAGTDEKGSQTRIHSLFRPVEEDGDDEDERDEEEDGDGDKEDEDGDEHRDHDNNREDDDDKGGNNGHNGNDNDNENNDDDQEGGIDPDINEDDKHIPIGRTHTGDHDDHHVNNQAESSTHNDNNAPVPYDPYASMTYEEIMSDPRDLGPDWDIHLSEEYKVKHPNPKYNVTPLDWWTEKLDDEWSVAVEWYQGGPDPDPRDIEWECPMAHDGRRYQVIKYIEPTEYRRYTQAEADATFCYGQWDFEQHARWLEEELVDLERWRKYQLRINLMINWRVRTGQQPPLCEGWWFMNEGQRWWETDPVRRNEAWMSPYG